MISLRKQMIEKFKEGKDGFQTVDELKLQDKNIMKCHKLYRSYTMGSLDSEEEIGQEVGKSISVNPSTITFQIMSLKKEGKRNVDIAQIIGRSSIYVNTICNNLRQRGLLPPINK